MTGAALPPSTDTVIRYEDLDIKNGIATLISGSPVQGQSIHYKGTDKKQHEIVAKANQVITPAVISLAASLGSTALPVRKLPRVVIISTGDELVEVDVCPLPYQVRRSNNYTIKAVLKQYALHADMLHIPDDPEITKQQLEICLHNYDVIIFTGGISMGKFDFVPKALEELTVKNLFYKVQQRPGKPFWFGQHVNGLLVFAFPGNPVSTFMCLHRYFLPWLEASSGIASKPKLYAILDQAFSFKPPLQYFLQVSLQMNQMGQMLATPAEGNGSGDFSNLVETDAFLELPMERDNFNKGEVFRVWPFRGSYEL
jgi:molybdopterin molybdotransferase